MKYFILLVSLFPSLVLAVDDATVQAIDSKASSANSKADGNNSRIQALETEDVILYQRIDTISLTPGPKGDKGDPGPQGSTGLGAVIFNSAPTVNDDMNIYSLGSIWIDTSANDVYILVDSTANSAIWKQITDVKRYTIGDIGPGGRYCLSCNQRWFTRSGSGAIRLGPILLGMCWCVNT